MFFHSRARRQNLISVRSASLRGHIKNNEVLTALDLIKRFSMHRSIFLWSFVQRQFHSFLSLRKLPRSFLLAGLSGFFAYSSFNLLVAVLPLYYAQKLGLNVSQIGLVVGFGFILNFLAYIVGGIAADRFGGTRYILWSALGLAVTAPLFGLFHTLWLLALVAILRGFTMSVSALALNAYIGEVVDPEQRGSQVGFFGVFTNVATALAPAAGVFLFQTFSTQIVFFAALVAGLIAALFGALLPQGENSLRAKRAISLKAWSQGISPLLLPASTMIAMGLAWG